MCEENQINSIAMGGILKDEKKYNSNCKEKGRMGQSVIKKNRTINTSFSPPCGWLYQDKKEEENLDFYPSKLREKHQNF